MVLVRRVHLMKIKNTGPNKMNQIRKSNMELQYNGYNLEIKHEESRMKIQ